MDHSPFVSPVLSFHNKQRLPHALLFVGLPGVGKKSFALRYAQTLLCNKTNAPCGQCHACHLIQAQSHPDFMLVEPEQDAQVIKIDQIRQVVQFVNETALQGVMRIVIINPASAMNNNAANSLLKTLEEPAPNTLIILLNDLNLRLPATIISRCQKIVFQKPPQEDALKWLQANLTDHSVDPNLLLKLADGVPIKAKELMDKGVFAFRQELYQSLDLLAQRKMDPLQAAVKYQEQDVLVLLNLLLVWLQDLLRYEVTQGDAVLINADYQAVFARLTSVDGREKLLNFLDHVKKTYAYMARALNLNRQLLLEELFIRWVHYATR